MQFKSQMEYSNGKYQSEYKKYRTCKKDYRWNPGTCICENGKYLKSIAGTSVIVYDEIIYVLSDVSINSDNKK